jgi:hypothetical protein
MRVSPTAYHIDLETRRTQQGQPNVDISLEFMGQRSESTVYMYNSTDADRVAVRLPIAQLQPSANLVTGELVRTEQTRQLLGYTCKLYQLRGIETTTDVWVAEGLDVNLMDFYLFKQYSLATLAEAGVRGIPLSIRSVDRNGSVVLDFTANNFTRVTGADATIQLPAGFNVLGLEEYQRMVAQRFREQMQAQPAPQPPAPQR